MKIQIRFSRPHLGARVCPKCERCDGRLGLIYDETLDVAMPCQACGELAAAAQAITRARLPTAAFGAVSSTERLAAPPNLNVMQRSSWRRAFDAVNEAVASANIIRVALSGGHIDAVPTTLFVVSGGASTGKTWMLCNAALGAARQGCRPLYLSATDPFATLSKIGGGVISAGVVDASEADILYIDDMGGQRQDKARGVLGDILRARLEIMRPTVVSVRVSQSQLTKEFGESIASRLMGAARHLDGSAI